MTYKRGKIPETFSTNSKPYGLTYTDWTAKWFQWLLSIPENSNPSNDETGRNCSINQNDPNVWFLAGTGGGRAERTCTIPAGKAILFPIINVECSYAEFPNLKTESELRACAKSDQDKVTNLEASIDGMKIQDLNKYRIQSVLFNVTLPTNNILGQKAGITEAVADGFYILLQPLPAGNHEIHFSGLLVDYTTTGPQNFGTETIYHLKVQ